MRTLPEEANFAKFLLDVGDGVLNDDDNNFIISPSCLAIADSDIVDDESWRIAFQLQCPLE